MPLPCALRPTAVPASVAGVGMTQTIHHLRLKVARWLVFGLWLHLPLFLGIAYINQADPLAPVVIGLVLACLATAVVLRRSLAPLGAVLVAMAFGGMVSVLGGLLQATPWQAAGPYYTAAAMALTLPLFSGPAVLAFASLALLPDVALQGLVLALPPHADALLRAELLAGEAAFVAALAQVLAGVLHKAQASTAAARQEAEELWQKRINAQIDQAAFITALVERITALARNPLNPVPGATAFPFAYAEVERAVDLLAQKLRQGGETDLSGFTSFAQIDLAAALAELACCLRDQSARLTALYRTAQGEYRANAVQQMQLDLADLTDQARQTAIFAAEVSQAAEDAIKTPLFGRPPWTEAALAMDGRFDKKASPKITSKSDPLSAKGPHSAQAA